MTQPSTSAARILLVGLPGPGRDGDRALFAQAGLSVFEAGSLQEAHENFAVSPDLYLIERRLPDGDGLNLLAELKSQGDSEFVPVMISTSGDTDERVEALSAGADESVSRPCAPDELLARVRALLRLKATHDRIRLVQRDLERLVASDPLTGLHNRRALLDRLKQETERYARYRQPLALAMLDLDGFKPINDTYGHLFGDHALRQVAETISRSVRTLDVAARYGGDEFAVILPQTEAQGALRVCERLLRNVSSLEVTQGKISVRVSLSLGLALYPGEGVASVEDLLRAADDALYRAKRSGRNRVCAVSAVRQDAAASA
jgi:two-component system cell cycle response regulator